ncbi:MAG TPA: beta-eliminating lyase-related protein [Phycisphaerales bacterium]|nr:beta-eliminating lyase-related protein [Phycisphaerales bacterium]
MRSFRSDNNAGLCPEALQAIIDANDDGHETGYGDDAYTARAVGEFEKIFGKEISVWFVATGTAANTLAVAAMTEPWETVLCHEHSHYADDESTAPERITHCRVTTITTLKGRSKLTVEDLKSAAKRSRGDVHQPQPGVFTISNTTEFGEVYTPGEVRALSGLAHELGFRVHMDGARFANAVAATGCSAAELTRDAGLDALSFGGTKNGMAYGEAVVFIRQGDGMVFERARRVMGFHRKGTGHLLSKHRFVAAQFAGVLAGDAWLRHARHANAMARKLSAGLTAAGLKPAYSSDANAVFVSLPDGVDAALKAKGHGYYPVGDPGWNLKRLMCSFNTRDEDVEGFLGDVRAAMGR